MEHLETQNCVDVAIDEAGQKADGSVQWLLEKEKDYSYMLKPTMGNCLKFFICGKEGFEALAHDLNNANETVDIICWGFDPGMELVRDKKYLPSTEPGTPSVWPWRGETYGDLLVRLATGLDEHKQKTKDPVKVRLLLWYGRFSSKFQGTLPGYEPGFGRDALDWLVSKLWSSPYDCKKRDDYCKGWWEAYLPPELGGRGEAENLKIVLRDVKEEDVKRLIGAEKPEEDKPEEDKAEKDKPEGLSDLAVEALALYKLVTHHQKTVLIDYGYEKGKCAVGYVMGLNSVTDYWDTAEHPIDTDLREKATRGVWKSEIGDEYNSSIGEDGKATLTSDKIREIHGGYYKSVKPYQDYACRIRGPALERVYWNFRSSWNELVSCGEWRLNVDSVPAPVELEDPARQVQIVRTQAHEGEKTVKKLYFHSVTYARHYIYIENQYFFYPEFARHLKAEREKYCEKWTNCAHKPLSEMPMLHLFIVIPHPEMTGMVPRTFDTLTELGMSDTMRGQAKYLDKWGINQSYPDSKKGRNGNQVLDRPGVEDLKKNIRMNVSAVRLCTSGMVNGMMAYREIYIHSKLMLIDDVFVTLGSANINQRSMSADSEINVAATGSEWASNLRCRVFHMLSGGTVNWCEGWETMPEVFDDWNKRAEKNYNKWQGGKKQLIGFLVKFEDMRSSWYKIA